MTTSLNMLVIYVTVFLLSIFVRFFKISGLLFIDNKYNEFLAIPALNNPRAGFARCKENNHV